MKLLKRITGSGWFWILLPVAILSSSVVGMFSVMYVASNDPSFSIEKDYYRKGVEWDKTMAQARKNDALGWTLEVVGLRNGRLVARLTDASGNAINAAEVSVEAFHNARANRVMTATLTDRGGGVYEAQLPAERRGLWELRFRVTKDGELFTLTDRQELL